MSSLTQYLRSGPVLSSQNPRYDDKGRQLPFQESPLQRHERHAFVKSSLQRKRNPANWLHDKRLAAQGSPSTSSSESPSPRTPASPLNHTHTDFHTPHEQRIKLQTAEALNTELQKLILASRQIHPPQHRQSRNYKNLHLPNTNAVIYQQQSPATISSQPARTLTSNPVKSVFDSPSYPDSVFSAYPSRHINADEKMAHEEPYIIYSSSHSDYLSPSALTTNHSAAGIGKFPYPASSSLRSSSHCRSLSSPLISPSSSSSPRTLTSLASYSNAGSASPNPRAGDH